MSAVDTIIQCQQSLQQQFRPSVDEAAESTGCSSLSPAKPSSASSAVAAGLPGSADTSLNDQQQQQQLWLLTALRAKYGCEYKLVAAGDIKPANSCKLVGSQQVAACSQLWCVSARGCCGGRRQLVDHLVVKLLPEDEMMKQLVIDNGMAVCETMMYRSLLPALIQHEKEHGSREVQDMLVPCYFTELRDDRQCAIVLENIQRRDFLTIDTLKLKKSQLVSAVVALAKFAAVSHSWLQHTGTEDLPFLLSNSVAMDDAVSQFVADGVERLREPLTSQPLLFSRLQKLASGCTQLLNRKLQQKPRLSVVCHGDFRDGNLLMRPAADGSWVVKVLDWQVSRLGSPVYDLLYLFLFSVNRQDRAQFEADCLSSYCHQLNTKLVALGCTSRYSHEQIVADFNAAKLIGLVWCLAAVKFWETVPNWAEHTIDLLVEVDSMGLLESI